MQETQVPSLGREGPLEKEMLTHSSTLAWKIPWMEKPGRLQSKEELDTTEQVQFHWTLIFKARSFVVVPWPEMEPMASAVLAWSLNHGITR